MNRRLSEVYPTRTQSYIGMGSRLILKLPETEYVLARIPGKPDNQVYLVNIGSGGNWSKPIKVADVSRLTREEVEDLIGPMSSLSEWEVKDE